MKQQPILKIQNSLVFCLPASQPAMRPEISHNKDNGGRFMKMLF